MFRSDDPERVWKEKQASARGERIRGELVAKLEACGPQTAPELYPQLPGDVSLSEVVFQLERLVDEGRADADGNHDERYRLDGWAGGDGRSRSPEGDSNS